MREGGSVTVTRESRRMSRVTAGGTFTVSHGYPSRPVPARPELSTGGPVCMASLLTQRARTTTNAMPGATR
jgi:hypothetical protein